MTDIEISPQEWPDCLQVFSLEHHGWLVNVRRASTHVLESDRAAAVAEGTLLASEQPLQRVSPLPHDEKLDLRVIVGSEATETSFLVENVTRLFRERLDHAHQGLRIDSEDGTSLLVEFRVPARPEELDGLAESEL